MSDCSWSADTVTMEMDVVMLDTLNLGQGIQVQARGRGRRPNFDA